MSETEVSKHGGTDPATLRDLLKEELSRGDGALARTETKISILLAVFGPLLTVGLAFAPRTDTATAALSLLWGALVLLACALLLLLWNVRPRLRGSGFVTYESMTEADLVRYFEGVAADPERWYRERLLVVTRLGARKFRMLRAATTLIMLALLLAIAAAGVAAVAMPPR